MTNLYVYGLHAVSALFKSKRRPVKRLIINQKRQDKRLQELLALAEQAEIPIESLTLETMNQRFGEWPHQGVVAATSVLPTYQESDLSSLIQQGSQPVLILIVDGITDPHNLGACLRTAEAVGVNFVISPKDKNVGLTPVASKVASGAAELIPLVRVTNLVRTIEQLKQEGIWIYGAQAEADKVLFDCNFQGPTAIVLGAEDKGLRRLTRDHCDQLFSLPMKGSVESLNVSVATGVALYEVLRQRS